MKPAAPDLHAWVAAIAVGVVAFVLVASVVVVTVPHEGVSLSGTDSLGTRAGVLSGMAVAIAFVSAYGHHTSRGSAPWRSDLPLITRLTNGSALAAAHAGLGCLIASGLFAGAQRAFRGMRVEAPGAAVLAGAVSAILAVIAWRSGRRTVTTRIAALAALTLVAGTLVGIANVPDPGWWRSHFSMLGNLGGLGAGAFNGAMILCGLLLTAMSVHLTHDLERGVRRRGHDPGRRGAALAWMFAAIGILMAVAGVITDAALTPVHVAPASGIVVAFAVFAVAVLRWCVGVARGFVVCTVVAAVGIVAAIALWIPLGVLNLTGTELLIVGILGGWTALLVRFARDYSEVPSIPDSGTADAVVPPVVSDDDAVSGGGDARFMTAAHRRTTEQH